MQHSLNPLLPSAVAVLLLSGCAGAHADGPSTAAPATSGGGAAATIDNCGFEVELGKAPERILAIKSTSLEMLLALGLHDRIVGSAFLDGPVPAEWEDRASDVPLLAEQVPSQETVLEAEPDFVFAGWESNLTADGAGERATLREFGIRTYVAPSACRTEGYVPDPMTFDLLFDEILQAGEVFGAADAAKQLVAEQRTTLESLVPSSDGLTALWYSSGTDTPYVGAGSGAPQMVLDAVGLENIAAGADGAWTSYSWEAIVDANPDVIVLVDAAWNSADMKIAMLKSDPVTAALPAVQQDRFLIVPFPASEAGVRTVDATADLIQQLETLGR
ncbi:putative F420-0 ABC transporter substrate-binding protein [Lysobacter korlensis]|uniref:F420-0 ABC transporter substrate-binding protein n=1 Tax=Lysobacter korlensis TaxID=553636 RepID=A0ABV6RUE8_9GAMM